MRLAGAGIPAGAVGTLALARTLRSVLFHVSRMDPAAFVIATGLLTAIAILASALPAARAAEIDPMATLREEWFQAGILSYGADGAGGAACAAASSF